ncbi:MAG: flagellar assembly protein FliW [Desulfuromonadaceae bacterium]|nr:flagellar assembly protein FliW [Desulfuromonas sp.]MDY0185022.1 flagellar assembly protein FliW [Desulfuromonadaceae bacterium]
MKIIQSRFGEVEYDPQTVLHFPQGLIGFEDLRDFVVMPNEKDGPLFWIQSVEDAQVALVLTDPTNFFPTYLVEPEAHECKALGMEGEDKCHALVVVTVDTERKVTLNLVAPVLFAPHSNRAIQVILENSGYSIQTPLPVVEHPAAKVGAEASGKSVAKG